MTSLMTAAPLFPGPLPPRIYILRFDASISSHRFRFFFFHSCLPGQAPVIMPHWKYKANSPLRARPDSPCLSDSRRTITALLLILPRTTAASERQRTSTDVKLQFSPPSRDCSCAEDVLRWTQRSKKPGSRARCRGRQAYPGIACGRAGDSRWLSLHGADCRHIFLPVGSHACIRLGRACVVTRFSLSS